MNKRSRLALKLSRIDLPTAVREMEEKASDILVMLEEDDDYDDDETSVNEISNTLAGLVYDTCKKNYKRETRT